MTAKEKSHASPERNLEIRIRYMPQPEMDIEDDERSVKPLVLFGHHMITDGSNQKKSEDAQFLAENLPKASVVLEPRPAGTGLLGALKTEKFKDHQLWVFSGDTPVAGKPVTLVRHI